MHRHTLAVWMLGISLALGLIGNIFFYEKIIGLSFFLFIGLAVLATLAVAAAARLPINRRNLWPLLPMLAFAALVAIRGDSLINTLNIGAVLALGGLALGYLTQPEPLDEATLSTQASTVIGASLFSALGGINEIAAAWRWLRERSWQGKTAVAVMRGLMLGLPVVVVFTLLLGSADVVFAGYVQDIWNLLALNSSANVLEQVMLIGGLGWVAAGAMSYGLTRHFIDQQPALPADDEPEAYLVQGESEPVAMEAVSPAPLREKRKARPLMQLGLIESAIVLGLVDALFAAFVIIQFAYFFGGEATIEARGLSYAEYARSGFFELVAVSVLTLGLALFLDNATIRGLRRENTIFRLLALVMIALVGVMLVSAAQRMWLYEAAYGFTRLRVYTHVAMLWIGVLFGAFVLSLFRLKRHVFALGVLVAAIGYLATLNVMNVDLYIAERNIARYHEGQALDLGLLMSLSVDAVPAMLPLYDELEDNPTVDAQATVGLWLASKLYNLDLQRAGMGATIFSANLAREEAWRRLDARRTQLPEYDPSAFRYATTYFDVYNPRYTSGWDGLTATPPPVPTSAPGE